MKVVALVSGGKDSCYAMQLAQQHGHEIVALANLLPAPQAPDDLNSYMFQTVGHQLIEAYATCTGLPLFRKHIRGASAQQDLNYSRTEGDEVEDLYVLLAYIKDMMPSVSAVTSGAIASDYQRLRVENVCARLGLVSLSYLWHQPQRALLRGMIDSGLHAILVKVAALGLDPYKHLGKSLSQLQPHLLKLNELYGSHVCGEGGEYESLVLDCPLFIHARIVLDKTEVVSESKDSMAPVAYLHPVSFHVEHKEATSPRQGLSSHAAAQNPGSSTLHITSPLANSTAQYGAVTVERNAGGLGTLLSDHVHKAHGLLNACKSPTASHAQQAAMASGFSSQLAQQAHGLPAAPTGVIMVPDHFRPPPQGPSSHRDLHRQSLESYRDQLPVTVLFRSQADYIQATAWVKLTGHPCMALASEITERHTSTALLEILKTLQERLQKETGLHLGCALYVHLLLANMGHFAAVNSVYCKVMPSVNPPSRTCVQLPLPAGVPVVVDILLARNSAPLLMTPALIGQDSDNSHGNDKRLSNGSAASETHALQGHTAEPASHHQATDSKRSQRLKKVLHVQSISDWAPSCIGPYSQATHYQGLVHMAGIIPLQPASMTVVQGGLAAQVQAALTHVQSVAIAMRCCAARAALCLVVYYAASIGPDGKALVQEAISRTLERTRADDNNKQGNKPKIWSPSVFSDLGPLVLNNNNSSSSKNSSHPEHNAEKGGPCTVDHNDTDEENDDDTGHDDELYMDDHLRAPVLRRSVQGNVTFVCVPALPRGCLIEIQPLLVDVNDLDARAVSSSSSSSSRTSQDAGPGCTRSGGPASAETGDANGVANTGIKATGEAASTGTNSDRTQVLNAEKLATLQASLATAGKHRGPHHHRSVTVGAMDRSESHSHVNVPHAYSLPLCALGDSDFDDYDADGVADQTPGVDGQQRAQKQQEQEKHVDTPDHSTQHAQQVPGHPTDKNTLQARPSASNAEHARVMVTTVQCLKYGLVKALYHLPVDVFSRPSLCQRLRGAIQSHLQSHGLDLQHVVLLRAWYDMCVVPAKAAAGLMQQQSQASCDTPGWHINWMPCSGLSTTACEGDGEPLAAVLEVLAHDVSVLVP